MKQYFVGIDIGSTASKVAVLCNGALADAFVLPTGWNDGRLPGRFMKFCSGKATRKICAVWQPVTDGSPWNMPTR